MAVLYKFNIAKNNVGVDTGIRLKMETIPILALFLAVMMAWLSDCFITGIPVITIIVLGTLFLTTPEIRKLSSQSIRYTVLFPLGIVVASLARYYIKLIVV